MDRAQARQARHGRSGEAVRESHRSHRHDYSLEEFGLSRAQVREALAAIFDRYGFEA